MRFAFLTLAAAGCVLVGLRAQSDPVADLKRALQAADAKQYTVAAPLLKGLNAQLPVLGDYIAWYLASAHSDQKNYAEVLPAAEAIFAHKPKSPFSGRASLLMADVYVKLNRPEDAIRVLKAHYSETTPPQTEMALADAYLAANDKANAAAYYQRVYFGYPQSPANPRALAALQKLETEMGAGYPAVVPYSMLDRAMKLLDAGQEVTAQRELEKVVPQLAGADRDLARVRIGAAMYGANKHVAAYDYLSKLEVASDEADAERLFYLTQSARRLDRFTAMDEHALRASALHPKSQWTVDALIAAGNIHLRKNDVALYEPLYQACYEGAPTDPDSEWCHWKVTWIHYLRRDRDAALMLRDHLRAYPDSGQSSAALYFLARLSEQTGDLPAARAYLSEVVREYPNVYYAMLARDRSAKLGAGPSAPAATTFLRTVAFPLRARTHDFSMTADAQSRIQRASLLERAGRRDLAEAELRFGAEQGEQPPVLGMELAKLLASDKPAQALKYIKRYARGYLMVPLTSAPQEFWQMAFPLPYRSSLERHSQANGVDAFLMAGLVRQESEFDAQVKSSSGAIGLSQIMPRTGVDLAGRLKISYNLARLSQPDYNLQLGTFYVRWLMDQLNGNVEATLASYNAGMTNAKTWMKWGDFREPAEFIETIPITETREYVQAVLRNAATYREIYGATGSNAAAE